MDEQPFFIDQDAGAAWRSGVNTDIGLGQTATSLGASISGVTVPNDSFTTSSGRLYVSPNMSPSTTGTGTGSTTTAPSTGTNTSQATPNIFDPSTWSLPSLGNVFGGMQSGPGSSGANDTVGSIEQWLEKIINNILIFGLGLLLIAAGLFLLAKETSVGQSTIREFRNAIPK